MKSISLKIRTKEAEVDFKADGASKKHITQAIDGLFNELSKGQYGIVTLEDEPIPAEVLELPVQPVREATEDIAKPLVSAAPPVEVAHVANHTELSEEPASMAEAVEQIETKEVPLHYKTGYKLDSDGEKRYKCRYRCTKCEQTGTHYIPQGVQQVDCHGCQTTLQVKKSTPGSQGIQADKFKNWYVAGLQLPVSEFIHGRAQAVK